MADTASCPECRKLDGEHKLQCSRREGPRAQALALIEAAERRVYLVLEAERRDRESVLADQRRRKA